MTIILGLMGAAGSGKSTAAKYLEEQYGAKRYSFAEPLKELAMRTLDFTHEQCYGTQAEKEAIDPRYGFSSRWFMQHLGTEGCRAVFGDDFWTGFCLYRIERDAPDFAVIEDVRFADEAVAIRKGVRNGMSFGGLIWRLDCPDRQSDADASHASEQGWIQAPFDLLISAPMSPGSALLKQAIDRAVEQTAALHRFCLDLTRPGELERVAAEVAEEFCVAGPGEWYDGERNRL